MSTIFISGIDTDIGKTYVTGLLGAYLLKKGKKVITQKIAQTGSRHISEDIITHRKLMGIELTKEDKNKVTCPYIFELPASPHLAAEKEDRRIDISKIITCNEKLSKKYDQILLEGAGGLAVPLQLDYTTLDFLEEYKFPTILVTTPKLGSINHTLMSLQLLQEKRIPLLGVVYNCHIEANVEIVSDSVNVFNHYLQKYGFNNTQIITIEKNQKEVDFSAFF